MTRLLELVDDDDRRAVFAARRTAAGSNAMR